jgi:hypothetical protein
MVDKLRSVQTEEYAGNAFPSRIGRGSALGGTIKEFNERLTEMMRRRQVPRRDWRARREVDGPAGWKLKPESWNLKAETELGTEVQSNLGFILARRETVLHGTPGTTITVHWQETDTTDAVRDAATGAWVHGGDGPDAGELVAPTNLSSPVRALVHEELPRSVVRKFQEVQTGDLLVELNPADAGVWEGKSGVRFEVPAGSGRYYVQEKTGNDLAELWDAMLDGQIVWRVFLLRRQT